MGRAFALVIAWLGLIGCFSLPYRDRMVSAATEAAESELSGGGATAVADQPPTDQHSGRAIEARKLAAMRRDLETEPEASAQMPAPALTKIVIAGLGADSPPSAVLGREGGAIPSHIPGEEDRIGVEATAAVSRPSLVKDATGHAAPPSKLTSRTMKPATKPRRKPASIEVAEVRQADKPRKVEAIEEPTMAKEPPMRLSSVNDLGTRAIQAKKSEASNARPLPALPQYKQAARKEARTNVQKASTPSTVVMPSVIAAVDQAVANRQKRKVWEREVRAREVALYKRDGI